MPLSSPRRARLATLITTRLAARVTAVAATLATGLAGVALATPAEAANRVTPGNFTGYGFDQCQAPSQAAMDQWLVSSPYLAVGIYIAGEARYCSTQHNLDAEWVATQLRNGWRLLPLTVGKQASCSTVDRYAGKKISGRPADNYAAAREQGRIEAATTVRAAKGYGIVPGSTLWFDLEHFDASKTRCRESALSFLSAWTTKLHKLGYVSGVYSSASSGIKALDDADRYRPGTYVMPDRVWIADWNGQPDLHSSYVRPTSWMPHSRVHQYVGDVTETHGGVTINIDRNYLSLGRGSVARKAPTFCGGVQVDFKRYPKLAFGKRAPQVEALQCLLRRKKLYDGPLTGRYNRATEAAVAAWHRSVGRRTSGVTTASTWTALLSAGGHTPVNKFGSAGNTVRRVQRALNAATGAGLRVTGVFDAATTEAVRGYQAERALARTGVVAGDTWAQLQRGRR